MKSSNQRTPVEIAQDIVRITTAAWNVPPESAHALTRRAPHGYEPLRRQRRRFFEAAAALARQPLMAHSW